MLVLRASGRQSACEASRAQHSFGTGPSLFYSQNPLVPIEYPDFEKVELRAGRVQRAGEFPAARVPAFKLWIDFGRLGVKQSSAQITDLYSPDELAGRLVIAVTNFPPKQIANFLSEVLVLGVRDDQGRVVLLAPDGDVPLGGRVF